MADDLEYEMKRNIRWVMYPWGHTLGASSSSVEYEMNWGGDVFMALRALNLYVSVLANLKLTTLYAFGV